MERSGRLAVLRMDKARGNAIDEAFAADMAAAVAEARRTKPCVASSWPRLILSLLAGSDLVSLIAYDRPGMDDS